MEPTPSDLERIAEWDLSTPKDYLQLMTFVRGLWQGGGKWDRLGGYYELHAHEDDQEVLESLRDNEPFWATCWESSNRHGTHIFQVPT